MYKLLKVFLGISFGGIASGGKSGLPQVLEWEIKIMLWVRDYLQLHKGFRREKGFSQNFWHPLRACRENHSVFTQSPEDHFLQCGLCPCWAPCSPLSLWALSLPQWSHFLTFWLLSKLKPKDKLKQTIKPVGNPEITGSWNLCATDLFQDYWLGSPTYEIFTLCICKYLK